MSQPEVGGGLWTCTHAHTRMHAHRQASDTGRLQAVGSIPTLRSPGSHLAPLDQGILAWACVLWALSSPRTGQFGTSPSLCRARHGEGEELSKCGVPSSSSFWVCMGPLAEQSGVEWAELCRRADFGQCLILRLPQFIKQ